MSLEKERIKSSDEIEAFRSNSTKLDGTWFVELMLGLGGARRDWKSGRMCVMLSLVRNEGLEFVREREKRKKEREF